MNNLSPALEQAIQLVKQSEDRLWEAYKDAKAISDQKCDEWLKARNERKALEAQLLIEQRASELAAQREVA